MGARDGAPTLSYPKAAARLTVRPLVVLGREAFGTGEVRRNGQGQVVARAWGTPDRAAWQRSTHGGSPPGGPHATNRSTPLAGGQAAGTTQQTPGTSGAQASGAGTMRVHTAPGAHFVPRSHPFAEPSAHSPGIAEVWPRAFRRQSFQ